MGSVGSDELLVARQADDGGAGELLRRHGAAGGRRGVGQVPRRHGLEEPLGRRCACGRAGRRRWRAVARVGVDGVRWGPLATHRVPRERDAKTPRRGAPQGGARTSKEQKDTASEPGSAATTSTRRSDRSAARLLRGVHARRDGVMKKDAAARQHGKRKRDGSSQRRVRRQETRQDREYHDAQRDLQRARSI